MMLKFASMECGEIQYFILFFETTAKNSHAVSIYKNYLETKN